MAVVVAYLVVVETSLILAFTLNSLVYISLFFLALLIFKRKVIFMAFSLGKSIIS
jgi:hypothetical protein